VAREGEGAELSGGSKKKERRKGIEKGRFVEGGLEGGGKNGLEEVERSIWGVYAIMKHPRWAASEGGGGVLKEVGTMVTMIGLLFGGGEVKGRVRPD